VTAMPDRDMRPALRVTEAHPSFSSSNAVFTAPIKIRCLSATIKLLVSNAWSLVSNDVGSPAVSDAGLLAMLDSSVAGLLPRRFQRKYDVRNLRAGLPAE